MSTETTTEDRCLVIERDNMTGWEKRLDNMARDPWADTFTREEAEASVDWRKKNITGRYSYEIRPVTAWLLDITTGDQHDLFMKALGTGIEDDNLIGQPRVCVPPEGRAGGQVWAYTRRGVNSPPAWLVKLCEYFENAGHEAGIRRPW